MPYYTGGPKRDRKLPNYPNFNSFFEDGSGAAFAAILADGSVVAWGDAEADGDTVDDINPALP